MSKATVLYTGRIAFALAPLMKILKAAVLIFAFCANANAIQVGVPHSKAAVVPPPPLISGPPPRRGQRPTVIPATTTQPPAPPRVCNQFKDDLDITMVMEVLLGLHVLWNAFDDAHGNGNNYDGIVSIGDVDAVITRHTGAVQPIANLLRANFSKLFPRKTHITKRDLLQLEREASRYRYLCRTRIPESEYDSRKRRGCEERLAQYRRYFAQERSALQRLRNYEQEVDALQNSPVPAAQMSAMEARIQEKIREKDNFEQVLFRIRASHDTAKTELLTHVTECGLYPSDAAVIAHDLPPPQGCPKYGSLKTECVGGRCTSCRTDVADMSVGQTCKDKESAQAALLLMCDYAGRSFEDCWNDLKRPDRCQATEFDELGSCRLKARENESKDSSHTINTGLNIFFPLALSQGIMAGGVRSEAVGFTSHATLAFHSRDGELCKTTDGCSFCDEKADIQCSVSVSKFAAKSSNLAIDMLGNGGNIASNLSEQLIAEVSPPIFQNNSGADWNKLRAACHLWREKNKDEIDHLLTGFLAKTPLRATSRTQCITDAQCGPNTIFLRNDAVERTRDLGLPFSSKTELSDTPSRRDLTYSYNVQCVQGECRASGTSGAVCTRRRRGEEPVVHDFTDLESFLNRTFGNNYVAPIGCGSGDCPRFEGNYVNFLEARCP